MIKRSNFLTLSLTFWLLILGISAPLAGAFLDATSAALGLILSSALILLATRNIKKSVARFKAKSIVVLIILLLYSTVQQVLSGPLILKSYLSFFAIVFLLYCAKHLGAWFSVRAEDRVIHRLAQRSFFTFLFIFLFNYLTDFAFAESIYSANRSVFPFGEPSHFALYAGPFFVFYGFIQQSITRRLLIFLVMISISVAMESLTFVFYSIIFLIIIFGTKLSSIRIFWLQAILLLVFYFASNNSYYLDRIIISSESTNLSNLVYLQGIQDAWNSLVSSYGFGIGFQMLGTQPPSDASYLIASILGNSPEESLNRFDGGFLSAKLIAEFGVLGIFALMFYFLIIYRAFNFLNNASPGSSQLLNKAFCVFLLCSMVELFVRGIGYFSPSLFLLIVLYFSNRSMILLSIQK